MKFGFSDQTDKCHKPCHAVSPYVNITGDTFTMEIDVDGLVGIGSLGLGIARLSLDAWVCPD